MYSNEKVKLINHLNKFNEKNNKESKKIIVAGDFGIGKSTMIKSVFNDEKFKNKRIKVIDAKEINDAKLIIHKANSFGYDVENKYWQWILNRIEWLSLFHARWEQLRSFKFILALMPIIFSLAMAIFQLPKIQKPLIDALIFVVVLCFGSGIIQCLKLLFCKTKKIVVIDNLDRINYDIFEKIITHSFQKNKTIIMVFDLKNISHRYREKFGFELQDPYTLLEKYVPNIINLEYNAHEQIEPFMKKEFLNKMNKMKFTQKEKRMLEVTTSKIVEKLSEYKIINFRILNKVNLIVLNIINNLVELGFDIYSFYFINILKIVDPVYCSVVVNTAPGSYNLRYSNSPKMDGEYHSEVSSMEQMNAEEWGKISESHKNNSISKKIFNIIFVEGVYFDFDAPNIELSSHNKNLFFLDKEIKKMSAFYRSIDSMNYSEIKKVSPLLYSRHFIKKKINSKILEHMEEDVLLDLFENGKLTEFINYEGDSDWCNMITFNKAEPLKVFKILEFISSMYLNKHQITQTNPRCMELIKHTDMINDKNNLNSIISFVVRSLNHLKKNLTYEEMSNIFPTPPNDITLSYGFLKFCLEKQPKHMKKIIMNKKLNIEWFNSEISTWFNDERTIEVVYSAEFIELIQEKMNLTKDEWIHSFGDFNVSTSPTSKIKVSLLIDDIKKKRSN